MWYNRKSRYMGAMWRDLMNILGFSSNSRKSEDEEFIDRLQHEIEVEKITVQLLQGEVSVEEFRNRVKNFDYRLDLRRVASNLS